MARIFAITVLLVFSGGCVATPWPAPSGPNASGVLLNVQPTFNTPPGMYVGAVRIGIADDGPGPAHIMYMDYGRTHEFPFNPMLVALPPGRYWMSHIWFQLLYPGYDPIYFSFNAPEAPRVGQDVKPGMVAALGEYDFEINVTVEGTTVNAKSNANGRYGPKILKKLYEDARKFGSNSEDWKPFLDAGMEQLVKP